MCSPVWGAAPSFGSEDGVFAWSRVPVGQSTSKLLPERGLDVAPQQQQQPLPPGLGPPQPVRTLPSFHTVLAPSLDRLWPRNALTLHTSWTVQEVTAAEARILESIHCEVGTYSPVGWVHLLTRDKLLGFSSRSAPTREGITKFGLRRRAVNFMTCLLTASSSITENDRVRELTTDE